MIVVAYVHIAAIHYLLKTEMKYVSTKLLSVSKHEMTFMLTTEEMVGYSQGMS